MTNKRRNETTKINNNNDTTQSENRQNTKLYTASLVAMAASTIKVTVEVFNVAQHQS